MNDSVFEDIELLNVDQDINTEIYEINTKDWITKSNTIIESQYKLTLQEQRILLITASKVQPSDEDLKPYKFRVSDLISKIGASKNSSMYSYIREVVTGLHRKTLSYKKGSKTIVANWLVTSIYEDSEGTVILKFNPELKGFFLHLKEKFTTYQLENVIQLNSVYSIRVYELLKQYETLKKRTFTIEEFRDKVGIEPTKYKQYGHLKDKVIHVAQKELAEKTDIEFTFEEVKKARKVCGLVFYIKSKSTDNKKQKPKQLDFTEEIEREEVKARLRSLDVNEKILDYIMENYSQEHILRNIEYVESKKNTLDSIGGYTYNAIKLDYASSVSNKGKRKRVIRTEQVPEYIKDAIEQKEEDSDTKLQKYLENEANFEDTLKRVYEIKSKYSVDNAVKDVTHLIEKDYKQRVELGLKPRFLKDFKDKIIKDIFRTVKKTF